MKSSSPKIAFSKNAYGQDSSQAKAVSTERQPGFEDGIINGIDSLYQQLNTSAQARDTESLSEDEVTLEEIIAKGSMPDETFVIDYGSEDDVPPPTDSDYLEFHVANEVLETTVNVDEISLNEDFDLPGAISKKSADKSDSEQDVLSPHQSRSGRNQAAAASTTLADEHSEAFVSSLWLESEDDSELHEAALLPLLDKKIRNEKPIWADHEIAATAMEDAAADISEPFSTSGAFADSDKKVADVFCMFCNHPFFSKNDGICQNCAAPVKPKRMFHDWGHAYSEPDTANPNLVSCRFCGHIVYRRAHKCPKCQNILLKPVYAPEEIKVTFKNAKAKPIKRKLGWFKYWALICLAIAIAALIVSKALTQAP